MIALIYTSIIIHGSRLARQLTIPPAVAGSILVYNQRFYMPYRRIVVWISTHTIDNLYYSSCILCVWSVYSCIVTTELILRNLLKIIFFFPLIQRVRIHCCHKRFPNADEDRSFILQAATPRVTINYHIKKLIIFQEKFKAEAEELQRNPNEKEALKV